MGDVERKGWMGRKSKTIHPVQEGQQPSPLAYLPPEPRRTSFLVPSILLINVVLFIATMFINNCPNNIAPGSSCVARFLGRLSFQPMRENPLLGPSSQTLLKLGALNTEKVTHHHQGWRLVTCIWLHGGVIHLLANMLSLLFIGIRLEHEFGFLRIGVIYLLSGFGGSLLSALFLQNRISVGASGALFGLLGAILSELIANWTLYANKCAALSTLVIVVAVNLAVGILPHVDNFAHIGGFITGFLAGFVFLVKPHSGWVNGANLQPGFQNYSKHRVYQYVLWVTAVVILLAGFVTVLVLVLHGVDGNKKCHWCHYLSCVPTSHWKCDGSSTSGICETTQFTNNIQITCVSNNRTTTAPVSASASTLQELCAQLCS